VGVAVKGKLDRGMPGEVLDVLRVRPSREQDSEASVPQIVPAYVRQTRPLEQGLEVTVDYVLCVHRRSDGGDEHKPIISPSSTCPKLFLYLPPAVASEGFYGPLRQVTVRRLAFFGSENTNPPPSRILCSWRLTRRVFPSRSISDHFNPNASPILNPDGSPRS
jgi:hypothetical protein